MEKKNTRFSPLEKHKIMDMKSQGCGYKAIASRLGLNCDAVKSFIRRHKDDPQYSAYLMGRCKTCKQDGPSRVYRDAMGADEVKKVFHKIDSARRMRVSRNPDDKDIQDEYKAWQKAMRRVRKQYKGGGITADQYISWLERHKTYNGDKDYS